MRIRLHRPLILIGSIFYAAFVVAAAPVLAAPSAFTNAPVASSALSGTWKGVYFTYPNLMAMQLDLHSTPAGAITGELKFKPAEPQRGALGGGSTGSYHVSGQYDEWSRGFSLKPGTWIEKPNMPGLHAPLIGVLDDRSKMLTGIFDYQSAPNPMFFVMAAEDNGDQLIADISHSAYPAPLSRAQLNQANQDRRRMAARRALEQLKTMPHPAGTENAYRLMEQRLAAASAGEAEPEWEAPPVDKLVDWASRLKQELPTLDLRNTRMEKLYLPTRNLFDDVYFQKHFGITYERMDTAQRKAIASVFSQHSRELLEFDFLNRPFLNAGDFGAPDITVSIFWQHTLRSWIDAMQASFTRMPAEERSFSNLSAAESAADALLPFLWPSERNRFHTALTDARTRLAGPVLTLHADRLIATATGNAGARELAGWQTQEKDILQYVSTTERDKFQQRIDTRLDKILEQLVAANVRSLATLGHGLDAVLAGNKWYQQFENSYDFALTRPPIQEALQMFRRVRAKNLIEAKPLIIAQLNGAEQEAQVQSVLGNYLICPGDANSEIGVAIRQHANQRLAFIQRAAAAARVGDGPFAPDYPGAAYLNALYRDDTARLAQEDRAVSEPLARSMTQVLQATGMDVLTSLFSGGVLPRGGLTQLITDQMRRFSIAVPLTGFFIVAYERIYPKCMDAHPVVFEETTTWDTVVTNGFGTEIARYPHRETNYYNVNKRHADAFRKVGPGTNPDQLDFTTQLFGPLLSKDVTEPLHTVTDTVRGLRIAMTQNACDSPLIKTIEKNMIAHVMAY